MLRFEGSGLYAGRPRPALKCAFCNAPRSTNTERCRPRLQRPTYRLACRQLAGRLIYLAIEAIMRPSGCDGPQPAGILACLVERKCSALYPDRLGANRASITSPLQADADCPTGPVQQRCSPSAKAFYQGDFVPTARTSSLQPHHQRVPRPVSAVPLLVSSLRLFAWGTSFNSARARSRSGGHFHAGEGTRNGGVQLFRSRSCLLSDRRLRRRARRYLASITRWALLGGSRESRADDFL